MTKTKKEQKPLISFQSSFEDEGETLKLKVNYNETLQNLLKKASVSGERTFNYFIGRDENNKDKNITLARTRVKTAIYNGFNEEGRDLIFIEDLIKKGEFTFEFYDVTILEMTIKRFSLNIRRAIEIILEYSNIDKKISFTIE